jgi:hypothetical protein
VLVAIAAAWFFALALTTSAFVAVVVTQRVTRRLREGLRGTRRPARAMVQAPSRPARAA